MSIYPSLEDMKVDNMRRAQNQAEAQYNPVIAPSTNSYPSAPQAMSRDVSVHYPALGEYMGLDLSPSVIAANLPEYTQIAIPQPVSLK